MVFDRLFVLSSFIMSPFLLNMKKLRSCFKWIVFLFLFSTFFMIQQLADQYHRYTYRLISFDEMQKNYSENLLKILSTINNDGRTMVFSTNFDINELYRLLQSFHNGSLKLANQLTSNNFVQEFFPSSVQSSASDELLKKFNLSIKGFNPMENLNDRLLQIHLDIVNQVDKIINYDPFLIKTTHSNVNLSELTSHLAIIDENIDQRRKLKQNTNLKLSDFRDIDNLIYGSNFCDSVAYGAKFSVVVFVVCKPDDFELRSLIRTTWARKFNENKNRTRLFFAFGQEPNRRQLDTNNQINLDRLFREENDKFHDIIQWRFDDGYYRLTIKSLAINRWASVYCHQAKSIFKVDADALVNYDNLMKFCDQLDPLKFRMYGNLWSYSAAIRSQKNKFFTSFNDFPHKYYPTYSGSAWLLSGRSLPLFNYLIAIQQAIPALLWEDVYISGILVERLKNSGISYEREQLPGIQFNVDSNKINSCSYRKNIIFTEKMSEKNLEKIWSLVNRNNSDDSHLSQWRKIQCFFNI